MNRIEPKANVREADRPETLTPDEVIIVFVCPTPGCSDYYAAVDYQPGNQSLKDMQYKRGEDGERVPLHARLDCPTCWLRSGTRVERVPYVVTTYVRYSDMLEATEKIASRTLDDKKRSEG